MYEESMKPPGSQKKHITRELKISSTTEAKVVMLILQCFIGNWFMFHVAKISFHIVTAKEKQNYNKKGKS